MLVASVPLPNIKPINRLYYSKGSVYRRTEPVKCSLMISLSVVNREGLSGRCMRKEVILECLVQFS